MRQRDALIQGNENKYLKDSLIPCQFSKMIVVDFSQGLLNPPAMGSWPHLLQYCNTFSPVNWTSTLVFKSRWTSPPITFIPLLFQWAYLIELGIVACRVHSWVGLLLTFLSQHPIQHLTALWKVASRKEAYMSVLA